MRTAFKRAFSLLIPAIWAIFASACASLSTTQQGAIGLERKQYFTEDARNTLVNLSAGTYDEMLKNAGEADKLNQNGEQVDRVVGIANRLIPQTVHFRDDALAWDWEVNVLTNESINATCMAAARYSCSPA